MWRAAAQHRLTVWSGRHAETPIYERGGTVATYRVSMTFPYDSTLPRDVISLNPHFSGDDPNALLQALDANLKAWSVVAAKPYTLKAYDALKAPPSFPLATVTQSGTTPNSSFPREVALCLSYYSTYNRPRYRGRLYLPLAWISGAPTKTPTALDMQSCLDFATKVLTKSLPANTNWVVYSRVDRKAYGVSDIWCDNEWDTVRSRGLKATTRTTAKV
jgi:hypothetical protein